MFLSVRPIQQQPLTKDIVNSSFLTTNGATNQQQRFGIGNSVSLHAIRSGIIEKVNKKFPIFCIFEK